MVCTNEAMRSHGHFRGVWQRDLSGVLCECGDPALRCKYTTW